MIKKNKKYLGFSVSFKYILLISNLKDCNYTVLKDYIILQYLYASQLKTKITFNTKKQNSNYEYKLNTCTSK